VFYYSFHLSVGDRMRLNFSLSFVSKGSGGVLWWPFFCIEDITTSKNWCGNDFAVQEAHLFTSAEWIGEDPSYGGNVAAYTEPKTGSQTWMHGPWTTDSGRQSSDFLVPLLEQYLNESIAFGGGICFEQDLSPNSNSGGISIYFTYASRTYNC
ncbi:MAG: hypothetical protein L3K15_06080, partial [Thermoplasmata archaeon]|nr:hypothetical protein [Thermoplasmata archaeon]